MINIAALRARPKQFRLFTGLTIKKFDKLAVALEPMAARQRPRSQRKPGGGRRQALPIFADRLLMVLVWERLYPVFFVLESLFGTNSNMRRRTIREIMPLLQRQNICKDPRKTRRKKIRNLEELKAVIPDFDEMLADAAEQPNLIRFRFLAIIVLVSGLLLGWLFFNRVEIKQDIEEWQRKKDLPPALTVLPTSKQDNKVTISNQEIKEISVQGPLRSEASGSPPRWGKDIIEEEKIIPPEINIAVPFLVQAPHAVWDQLHKEACEEAALIMFSAFYHPVSLREIFRRETGDPPKGDKGIQKISQDEAELAIQNLVKWEKENLGFFESTNAEENVRILKEYFGLSGARAVYDITVEDIKKELAAGRPMIVPAAGRLLPNPYYRRPGPLYHMLLIKGYTKDGRFITNDPGTKRGKDFTFKFGDLYNAIHDWVPGGDILTGRKTMIVER